MKKEPEAYIDPELFDPKGIGHVVVCRYKASGTVEAGVFLVDAWCLGVKNAFFRKFETVDAFQTELERFFQERIPEPVAAANGRKLVEGAVAYAQSLGFAPHRDYKKGARVFGGIHVKDSKAIYTFGKDGKPCYISGPYDNAEHILAVLGNR